jgi:hypothetical protein
LEQEIQARRKPCHDQRKLIVAGEETELGQLKNKFEETHKELEK